MVSDRCPLILALKALNPSWNSRILSAGTELRLGFLLFETVQNNLLILSCQRLNMCPQHKDLGWSEEILSGHSCLSSRCLGAGVGVLLSWPWAEGHHVGSHRHQVSQTAPDSWAAQVSMPESEPSPGNVRFKWFGKKVLTGKRMVPIASLYVSKA